MILADAETPAGTRGQIEMLMALTAADEQELRACRCAVAHPHR